MTRTEEAALLAGLVFVAWLLLVLWWSSRHRR